MAKQSSSKLSARDLEERVRELEGELYFARRTLLHMVDSRAQEIFQTMPRRTSAVKAGDWAYEAYCWFEEAMDQVLKLAEPMSTKEHGVRGHAGDRARCPLCGDSSSVYGNPDGGFALPTGLRRHLLGENKANQCDVAKEVLAQVRYCSRPLESG